jgi:hypothetical protein
VPGFRVDLDLGPALEGIADGAEKGVRLAVEHLLTEANKQVPHDEGTLERSGATGVERSGAGARGSVTYDTPYAVRQHEDMELNHHGKGRSKWLETTMAQEAGTVGKIIATSVREGLGS